MTDLTNPNAERFRKTPSDESVEGCLGASSAGQGEVTPSALATPPPIDLAALTVIANAATEGPWRIYTVTDSGGRSAAVETAWAHDEQGEDTELVTDWCTPEDAAHIVAFDPPTALALIARVEAAELWTVAHPCQVSHEQPYDFKWCETHDRTFPLDGDCDHKGKSAIDWLDNRENEQRVRAIRAEDALEDAKSDTCPCDFNRPQDCKPELYMHRHRVMPAWTRAEAAEAKIAAVRELHPESIAYPLLPDGTPDLNAAPMGRVCLTCSDESIEGNLDDGEWTVEDGGNVFYPCPTIAALDGGA